MTKVWFSTAMIAAGVALSAAAIEIDGVAARVGTETILKSDVIMEMRRTGATESHYKDVLDDIIERKLILKAAGESKMTMQEWVVESRVREIILKSFGGDRNKLLEALAKDKVSYPEWYANLKQEMIVGAMRYQVIDKYVSASPAAMRKEYETHPERYSVDAKVTISVILLSPENIAKRELISNALKTEDFGELARKHSADSHAEQGGVWKDVVPSEIFKPEVCVEIARMPKGTISHWIEIDGWSYLLRMDGMSSGKVMSFEESIDKIEANVKEAAAKEAYVEWIKRLRAETYVKIY